MWEDNKRGGGRMIDYERLIDRLTSFNMLVIPLLIGESIYLNLIEVGGDLWERILVGVLIVPLVVIGVIVLLLLVFLMLSELIKFLVSEFKIIFKIK
jgi:hypothetical protein